MSWANHRPSTRSATGRRFHKKKRSFPRFFPPRYFRNSPVPGTPNHFCTKSRKASNIRTRAMIEVYSAFLAETDSERRGFLTPNRQSFIHSCVDIFPIFYIQAMGWLIAYQVRRTFYFPLESVFESGIELLRCPRSEKNVVHLYRP